MKAITNYINNGTLMFLHYQHLTILPLFPLSFCHANDKTSIFNSDILANCQGNNDLSSWFLSLEKPVATAVDTHLAGWNPAILWISICWMVSLCYLSPILPECQAPLCPTEVKISKSWWGNSIRTVSRLAYNTTGTLSASLLLMDLGYRWIGSSGNWGHSALYRIGPTCKYLIHG